MLWTYEGIVLRLKKNIIKSLAIKHTSNKLLSVIHSKRKLEADQQHHHLFFCYLIKPIKEVFFVRNYNDCLSVLVWRRKLIPPQVTPQRDRQAFISISTSTFRDSPNLAYIVLSKNTV